MAQFVVTRDNMIAMYLAQPRMYSRAAHELPELAYIFERRP